MQISKFKHWCTLILFGASSLFFTSCGSGGSDKSGGEQAYSNQPGEETESEVSNEIDALAEPMKIKGVGPIKELKLDPTIDQQLAQEGQVVFEQYCTACHRIDERFVGPPVKEVTTRRSPEWIMNMILNPEVMVKEDPIAKELLREYLSPMANQNLTEQQARGILEYFRTLSEVETQSNPS